MEITKSSGQSEAFSQRKLMRSLRRAGASEELSEEVWQALGPQVHSGMSSKQLEHQAFRLLKQLRHSVAARYQLKRAIMELGPSGYPFERLMGALFAHQGYEVQVGQILKGHCVTHEVDVVARQDRHPDGHGHDHLVLVECKYRNTPGFKCDVKVPLYIQSRFEDIRGAARLSKEQLGGWIATNARFTGDAIKYAECVGLKLLGWDHPESDSLSHWLDQSRLYPLTVLTSLSRIQKQALLAQNLILCQDILERPVALHKLPGGLAPGTENRILEECRALVKV